jgi:hypothetical protein
MLSDAACFDTLTTRLRLLARVKELSRDFIPGTFGWDIWAQKSWPNHPFARKKRASSCGVL